MPWSGGVYTRGYPSWTNDANNNLPISATKFDLEDNDFASGLQNCLTVDGTNKPTATLSWPQIIALTRASDGTLFSLARTSGSNNSSLTWSVTDSTSTFTAALTGNATPSITISGGALQVSGSARVGGTAAPSSPFDIQATLASFSATGNSHARLINTSATGQSPLDWLINGSLTGRIRNDFNGNMNFVSIGSGEHDFWVAGDSGVGLNAARITNPGVLMCVDEAAVMQKVGYRGLVQNLQNVNYTTVLADGGKSIVHTSGSSHTFTIAANASVAYDLGTVITFVNVSGAATISIAINSDSLVWAATGGTGTRTLATVGIATAIKTQATQWLISGTGLT